MTEHSKSCRYWGVCQSRTVRVVGHPRLIVGQLGQTVRLIGFENLAKDAVEGDHIGFGEPTGEDTSHNAVVRGTR